MSFPKYVSKYSSKMHFSKLCYGLRIRSANFPIPSNALTKFLVHQFSGMGFPESKKKSLPYACRRRRPPCQPTFCSSPPPSDTPCQPTLPNCPINISTPNLPDQIPKPNQSHLSQIFTNENAQIKCKNENAT